MKVIMYSTGCPKCKVLESKLNSASIPYEIFNDTEKMINMGITTIPILEIDNKKMGFEEAVKWINEKDR